MKNLRKNIHFLVMGLILIAVNLVTVGCGLNTSKISNLLTGQDLISNRPSIPDTSFLIVKLKTLPLIDTATMNENGKLAVDADQRATLIAEQDEYIKAATAAVPEFKVVYRYQMTLNGLAISIPTKSIETIRGLVGTKALAPIQIFSAPKALDGEEVPAPEKLEGPTPIQWIGADKAQQIKVKKPNGEEVSLLGQGIRVGVIDTGIDYTHSMMLGVGSAEAFKAIDPSQPSLQYPNKKVVGGIDLVGTAFDSASADEKRRIPVPDANPIDEGGHGSHVAGTIAGHGDNEISYSGVAPEADLYAIKVFGATGSTSDSVVIAALEYAVDPNGDGDLSDRLDVLNLSLGSDFGSARGFYRDVLTRVDKAGIAVAMAAGNAGNFDYIAGSPGVNDEALAVAASVDNSNANILFGAVAFEGKALGRKVVERVEGTVGKPIKDIPSLQGELVYVGLADQDFTPEQLAAVKGKVALIDRGIVPFADKVHRAHDAGAVGVVVANNSAGEAFAMGGDGSFPIPAVMIKLDLGTEIKKELAAGGAVTIDFTVAEKIERKDLIDTIVDFSSKGPRGGDSVLKPEISAPGKNILSTAMGQGTLPVRLSGTSMATPHMAGVLALMRQAYPTLTPHELKSIVMGRSVPLKEPISRQGAGRVQVDRAVTSPMVTMPEAFSLGRVQIQGRKILGQQLNVKNLSAEALDLEVSYLSHEGNLKLKSDSKVSIAAGKTLDMNLEFAVNANEMPAAVQEMSGWVVFKKNGEEVYRVAVLAVVRKISNIVPESLKVSSDSEAGAEGSLATLTLKNTGKNEGEALLFNLLGFDERKSAADPFTSDRQFCDLQAVGYRVITKANDQGISRRVLQVVGKFYEPLTTFSFCELTVLIDGDGDGVPDQELGAVPLNNVEGFEQPGQNYASMLLDYKKMREIRMAAEEKSKQQPERAAISYAPALLQALPFLPRPHSTIQIVEAEVERLARSTTGLLNIKIASLDAGGDDQTVGDDYYKLTEKEWMPLSTQEASQSFQSMPEAVALQGGQTSEIKLKKGQGTGELMVLTPNNATVSSDILTDLQMSIVKPEFSVE